MYVYNLGRLPPTVNLIPGYETDIKETITRTLEVDTVARVSWELLKMGQSVSKLLTEWQVKT